MTVSRALNSLQLVRPKTVEKVMQAVADYLLKKGYRRHGLLWTADRRAIGQRVASIVSNKFHVKTILLMSDFTWLKRVRISYLHPKTIRNLSCRTLISNVFLAI
ncbi:hypothetical protein [Citrobacter sp. Cf084]|uniref:hypothetical protein n=1 Tax=Citrobacter sp. Cf084 TaxID=2985053 RepID=UPI00259E4D3D|nr:LacI family DNA-binding transcriptional regulator [Citrobacter freundii]EKU4728586.1 LacI family DNA-binding transcriptional regulator [Citrobacter freundii]EKV2291800.1 LacI family DNA-binding transcriptional regulator [Citrobacter freundii]EKW0768222.1 LacI family DNA-binding transcriptional regulator [Citrobacter freundii]HCL6567225.1 LacI family DNA-binding transcriptional regulator [Citrobacter freundii]